MPRDRQLVLSGRGAEIKLYFRYIPHTVAFTVVPQSIFRSVRGMWDPNVRRATAAARPSTWQVEQPDHLSHFATPSCSLFSPISSYSSKEFLGGDGSNFPVNFMVNWLIWNQSSFSSLPSF
jgi:hypothetical protein